jgi:DNA-binding beta-propeller fold protein YncE
VPPFEGQNSGTNEVLNHTIGVPHDFALLRTNLFWTDQDAEKIFAADVAPGQPDHVVTVVSCSDAPVGLAIDPQSPKVYWAEDAPGAGADMRIMRADIDSGTAEEFLTWSEAIRDLTFDPVGRDLYFASYYYSGGVPRPQAVPQAADDYVIVCQGADEETAEIVIRESNPITEIAIHQDGRKLYWYNSGAHKIKRANLDGTSIETIVSDVSGVGDLAIDEQDHRIVWVSYVGGVATIASAALDGSDVRYRLQNSMSAQYTAIAIGPKPD